MVAKLGPSNILFQHSVYVLHHSIPNSWFVDLRTLTLQYRLQDPLQTLMSPPLKSKYKSVVKSAVRGFWHAELSSKALSLPSLCYLRPAFLPLGPRPHPLWWTCQSSPSAVRAATVQAKMLSGRYRSCWLRRHWTQESGACRLPGCGISPGDVAHIVSGECHSLKQVLAQVLSNIWDILSPYPPLLPPVIAALNSDKESFTTFILDPSTDQHVISLAQTPDPGP